MGNIFSQNNNNSNLFNNKFSKTIKSQYFSEIKKILRYNYEQGFNEKRMKNNMMICLEKKCFDEIYDNEEQIVPLNTSWLDYLYSYLSSELIDKEWAREMLIKLDDEPFLTENKYLSHFFYKEFLLNTEPNCIKDKKDEDLNNNDSDDDLGNNEIDLKTSMNNSNMMKNLGGTFMANANIEIDNSSVSSNHENDNDKIIMKIL